MYLVELNNEILLNIYKKYLNGNLYYCNVGLICRKFKYIFDIFYNSSRFRSFDIPFNLVNNYYVLEDKTIINRSNIERVLDELKLKCIYYVRSKKYNIKFVNYILKRLNYMIMFDKW